MESLRTKSDLKTIKKLLSWLNAPSVEEVYVPADDPKSGQKLEPLYRSILSDRLAPLIEWLNDIREGILPDVLANPILNRELEECDFFPQLEAGEIGVRWVVRPTEDEVKARFDLAVQEILSLRDRDLLWRLRKCDYEPCGKWLYAWNRKKRFHSKKCSNAADYARMTPAEREKMKKEARVRMRNQRRNAKERERKELELSRKRGGRGR